MWPTSTHCTWLDLLGFISSWLLLLDACAISDQLPNSPSEESRRSVGTTGLLFTKELSVHEGELVSLHLYLLYTFSCSCYVLIAFFTRSQGIRLPPTSILYDL